MTLKNVTLVFYLIMTILGIKLGFLFEDLISNKIKDTKHFIKVTKVDNETYADRLRQSNTLKCLQYERENKKQHNSFQSCMTKCFESEVNKLNKEIISLSLTNQKAINFVVAMNMYLTLNIPPATEYDKALAQKYLNEYIEKSSHWIKEIKGDI